MTSLRIPFLDLRRAGAALDAELEEAFRRVLRSGQYILGREVTELERACAEVVGVRHAIGVSSGTDALLVALMALGVGPGDEVICPTYSFVATASVIARVGATPVFADCADGAFNVDPDDIARKVTPRTRAILPVHLFGRCAAMGAITRIAHDRDVPIPVIEDAAQALGATCDGQGAGSLGTVGCFSFFPTKNLGAIGDAGLVTTNDPALAEGIRALRVQGATAGRRYEHARIGGNFRMDELQAALLRVKLPHLGAATAARRENVTLYERAFRELGAYEKGLSNLHLPEPLEPGAIAHQLVVRIPTSRDAVRESLLAVGVETAVYYPVPLHRQRCFAVAGREAEPLPRAEQCAREALALPIFPGLTHTEVRHVATEIVRIARGFAAPLS